MRVLIAALMFMLITGCSSMPTLVNSQFAEAPNTYPVSIERGTYLSANRVAFLVWADGKEAGQVTGGKVVTLWLPEGRHTVGVSKIGKSASEKSLPLDVSADNKPVLHTNFATPYGGLKLERVNQ